MSPYRESSGSQRGPRREAVVHEHDRAPSHVRQRRSRAVEACPPIELPALTLHDPRNQLKRFDVVINATSASLSGALPLPQDAAIFAPDALAYDMMYGKAPTVFLQWAGQHGAARTCDGLGMLVEQAAESYVQWRGVLPPAAPVMAQLRAELLAS